MTALNDLIAEARAEEVELTVTADQRAAVDEIIALLEPVDPPDPLGVDGADVKVGDPVRGHTGRQCGQRLAGAPIGNYAYCRRPEGHDPRHPHLETLARNSADDSVVSWVWGKGEAPLVETPTDEVTDSEDAKLESYEEGMFCSYRNKRRALMILSRPKKADEGVEILDLTNQRLLRINRENLVPRREDDPAITAEQFEWLGRFLAERRKKAREVALREMNNRRWDRSTMNESLQKLDIEPMPAIYGGTVEFSIGFTFPDGQRPTREQAQRLIMDAIVKDHGPVKVTRITNWYGGQVNEVAG
jgi:hypothetical protein